MSSPLHHEMIIRVRYCETDAMGYLHHSQYANYFEMGRTELFRSRGGNYREFEERGYFLVVAHLKVQFQSPARYDDVLTLRTTLSRMGAAKMEHEYRIFRDGKLLTTGHTVLACVDREGNVQRLSDVLPPDGE